MQTEKYEKEVQILTKQILALHRSDADKTREYCLKLIRIGEEKKDPALLGFGYFYISESSYYSNNLDLFFEYATKALPFLDQANDRELTASCYNHFGIWAMNKGNFPLAQDYYFNALKYCRQYHLIDIWVKVSVNLGVLNNICGCYKDAHVYLEEASNYIQLNCKDTANYHNYIIAVYENLIFCFTMLNQYAEVEKLIRTIHDEHWEYISPEDQLLCNGMEAIYYNRIGTYEKRDSCIQTIQNSLNDNSVTVMDMFEDYHHYALMLIDAGKDTEFLQLIDTMRNLVENSPLIRMKLHLENLMLKYYQKHSMQEEYLNHAAKFYELFQQTDDETRDMMGDALNLRKNLEQANIEKTKMETENRLLLLKSETDALTGLYNRFRMDSYAEEVFVKCINAKTPIAVEILDIDYFKQYNDNYGHQSGDACLVKVAGVLKQICEKYHAFCARYGGDEFILIYTGLTNLKLEEAASDLKAGILKLGLEHKYSEALPCVTISQGICHGIPKKKNRMWDFLHVADQYLYQVKSVSRNSYCIGDLKNSYSQEQG